ncbi:MAG: OmpH family outer membrane protein [Nitrosomonadales bacterium]|nr:MAG: OmpH family outer membrane protein [Nitrosomonadales bacterium]
MSKLLQFVLAAGLAFVAAGAAAETKIGYVKMDKIMQSPDSIESGKRLQKEFSPRNEELGRFKKQIEDKETALDKEAAAMSENDRRKKYQELSDLKLEFQRKQRELSEDFVIRKNEERSKLQERINNAVTSVSKAEGYDLVLYGNAAYAGKKVDMTDKVLKALAK